MRPRIVKSYGSKELKVCCSLLKALSMLTSSYPIVEYANRLNLKRWPKVEYTSLFKAAMPEQSDEPLGEAQRQQGKARDQPTQLKQDESLPSPQRDEPDRLQHFNVWVGDSTLGSESARVSPNDLLGLEKVTAQRDGIALVYMPLLSKEVMETWSTWRFEYPPEETEKLLKMAESSIERGEAQLKAILKGIYQRKKARRLDLEADA